MKSMEINDISGHDTEITILHGTLAEVYYLLKDRGNKGIENAMYHIETVYPDVRNYSCE